MIQIRSIEDVDRSWLTETLQTQSGSTIMVTKGQIYDLTMLPGLIASQDATPVGLLVYHLEGAECEVVTLNSWGEERGAGTALMQTIQEFARQQQCQRLWLITTNDNLPALHFYQERGFVVKAVYANAIEMSRMFKPEIPLIGHNGIPIQDEIELELPL